MPCKGLGADPKGAARWTLCELNAQGVHTRVWILYINEITPDAKGKALDLWNSVKPMPNDAVRLSDAALHSKPFPQGSQEHKEPGEYETGATLSLIASMVGAGVGHSVVISAVSFCQFLPLAIYGHLPSTNL